MELNKVYNMDCMEGMKNFPDGYFQLVIVDPPYFEVKGEFDFVWESFQDYLKDVEKWVTECSRLLSDNGTLYWYGSSKKIAYTQVILDKHLDLLNNLVWNKGVFLGLEFSSELRTFAPCTERVLMYSKEKYNLTECVYHIRDYIRGQIEKAKGGIIFNQINEAIGTATTGGGVASACLSLSKSEPTMVTSDIYKKLQEWCYPFLRKEYEELRKEYEEKRRCFTNVHNLKEVLEFSNESSKTGSKYEHDTVKPETLTRALIQTSSRQDDNLLIPFAGSGTECAMAVKEGRNFIGFDIEKKYVEMANERVNRHKAQTKLF